MDDFARAKIEVCADLATTLHTQVPKDCLEQKYGGTQPDKTDNFFPPEMSIAGQELLPSVFESELAEEE